MDVKELRIGNYVLIDNEVAIIAELHLYNNIIGAKESIFDNFVTMNNTAIPIELTSKILKEIGFKYESCGICGQDEWAGLGFWTKENITFRGSFKGKCLYFNSTNIDINFVHQLQNLYYSLTREDLKWEGKNI